MYNIYLIFAKKLLGEFSLPRFLGYWKYWSHILCFGCSVFTVFKVIYNFHSTYHVHKKLIKTIPVSFEVWARSPILWPAADRFVSPFELEKEPTSGRYRTVNLSLRLVYPQVGDLSWLWSHIRMQAWKWVWFGGQGGDLLNKPSTCSQFTAAHGVTGYM